MSALKKTAQEMADERLLPEYRRPVVDIETAISALGWWLTEKGTPVCCNAEIPVKTFFGTPYSATCPICQKFVWSAFAPEFGNSGVSYPDIDKCDLDDPKHWIWGQMAGAQRVAP